MQVHVAGAGAAGCAVARALASAGWSLGLVASRSTRRAAERCRLIGSGRPTDLDTLARGVVEHTSRPREPVLLLVAVADRHIAEVAARLATGSWPPGSVALHLSGSVEISALAPLAAAGLATGGFHPLKSFVDAALDDHGLRGVVVALEGAPAALAVAEQIAADTGARAFRLLPGRRAAWHAAAAHAANHLVALVDQSLDLMERAGLSRDAGRAALVPLLAGTVENLAQLAPGPALTGPVVRGDLAVVRRHLDELATLAPDVALAYRALARRALRLAVSERGLDRDLAAALAAILEER